MTKHPNSGFLGGNGLRLKKRMKDHFPCLYFFRKAKRKMRVKKTRKM